MSAPATALPIGAAALACCLVAAAPRAWALDGLDVFDRVCIATYPSFAGAAATVEAIGGVPVPAHNLLLEGIEAGSTQGWTIPVLGRERYLVETASGRAFDRPAASCGVADRQGFTLADAKARLMPITIVERPRRADDVLDVSTIDLVRGGPGKTRMWVVLRAAPLDRETGDARRLSMATLVKSDKLDALMSEVR